MSVTVMGVSGTEISQARAVVFPLVRRMAKLLPIVVVGNGSYLVASILAARVLSPEDFSLYAAQLGLVAILSTAMSGLQLDFAHTVASTEELAIGSASSGPKFSATFIALMMTGFVVLALPLFARLWNVSVSALLALSIAPVAVIVTAVVNGVLQGSRRFGTWFSFSATIGGWRIAVLLVALVLPVGVGPLMALLLTGGIAIAVVYSWRTNARVAVRVWKPSRRFAVLSVCSAALWAMIYADLLFVRRYADGDMLVSVVALLTISKGILALPIMVGQLLFPDLVDPRISSTTKAEAVTRIARLTALVGTASAVALGLLGQWILRIVYGINEPPTSAITWIVSASIVPLSVLLVVANFAMSATSVSFALTMAIVTCLYYGIGIYAVETVVHLIVMSAVAPLVVVCWVALMRGRLLRWSN